MSLATQFERLKLEIDSPAPDLPFEIVPGYSRDPALRVVPHDDNAHQWSLSAGGVTGSPAAELESHYAEAIGRELRQGFTPAPGRPCRFPSNLQPRFRRAGSEVRNSKTRGHRVISTAHLRACLEERGLECVSGPCPST